jgi:hypothetical protein
VPQRDSPRHRSGAASGADVRRQPERGGRQPQQRHRGEVGASADGPEQPEPERRGQGHGDGCGEVVNAQRACAVLGRSARRQHRGSHRGQAEAHAEDGHERDERHGSARRLQRHRGQHDQRRSREQRRPDAVAVDPDPRQRPEHDRHQREDGEEHAHLGGAPAERHDMQGQHRTEAVDGHVSGDADAHRRGQRRWDGVEQPERRQGDG